MFWKSPGGSKKRNNKGVLMKKLMMFAAAVTIVGSAFAQCGDPDDADCALAYDVKLSVKTTVPDSKAGYVLPSHCGDPVTNAATCIRKTGKKTIQGFFYTCKCLCDEIENVTSWYLWDKKAKVGETMPASLSFHVIGRKKSDVEVYVTLSPGEDGVLNDGTLYLAGFGKWDTKNCRVKSASGNFAGQIAPPKCNDALSCDEAAAYICDPDSQTGGCALVADNTVDTVAFGTWSIKYSSSKAKKLIKDSSAYLDWLPDYF
jgi:hypothetical protein